MRATHPTKQHLIDTATALIEEHGAQGFTVEQLLEMSHISKGSLYHHFADFADVITQSQTGRFAKYVAEDIELLTTVMVNTTSRENLLERLEQVARAAHGPDRAKRRLDRAAIISSSQFSETGRVQLAATQQLLTDSMSDLVRELQERKLIDVAVDPQAFATFVQAYSLGLVLDDVTENPVDQEAWLALIGRMLRGLI